MSFERPLAGTGPGAEPPIPSSPASGETSAQVTPAMKLQILSTEHWSLLASRSLAWNESFSRAGMFLAALSGAIVALALVAQASDFGQPFRIFALIILSVVLVVGIGTNLRMGMSNYHDAQCVKGMNRIRAGYLELAPELDRYFVMGTTDDQRGIELTMAIPPHSNVIVLMLSSTPMLVSTLNSILFGVVVALLAMELGTALALAVVIGVAGFFASLAAWLLYGSREIAKAQAEREEPLFPTRPTEPVMDEGAPPVA